MIQFYGESGLESVESEISILNKNPNQIIIIIIVNIKTDKIACVKWWINDNILACFGYEIITVNIITEKIVINIKTDKIAWVKWWINDS